MVLYMVHLFRDVTFHRGGSVVGRNVRKLTIEVPADLLARATTASGEGVTPTVRRGLELVAAGGAYGRLRRFRGKVKFGIKLSELRQD
jgi:hypothetical protein